MKTYLCFDASNVLQRTFMAGWSQVGDKEMTASLAIHSGLITLSKYFTKYNPDKVICVFDKPNWRKEYTLSDKCLSKSVYKGKRRLNFTPSEQLRYEEFIEHITKFEELLRAHTSVVCMSRDKLEADDILAGFAEVHSVDSRVIIISADRDFTQLLKLPNVAIIDPASDKPMECEDVDWFMFLKCIRGDKGDCVLSAYPNVRETRVRAAFNDPIAKINLLHEEWTNKDKEVMVVGDLFKENELLMDLFKQPPEIRELIFDTIKKEMEGCGKYSHFHFIKFCNRHNLIKIKENVGHYVKLLAS